MPSSPANPPPAPVHSPSAAPAVPSQKCTARKHPAEGARTVAEMEARRAARDPFASLAAEDAPDYAPCAEAGRTVYIDLPDDATSRAGTVIDQPSGFYKDSADEIDAMRERVHAKMRAIYGDDCGIPAASTWRCEVVGTTAYGLTLRVVAPLAAKAVR